MPDFTAATILDKFQNETAAQAVERVLKKLSTAEAQQILKVNTFHGASNSLLDVLIASQTREPRLPSHTFISSYFAAFRTRTSGLSRFAIGS